MNKILAIYLIPSENIVGGGIRSIFSQAQEARVVLGDKSTAVISVLPGHKTYGQNKLFRNAEKIYNFDKALNECEVKNLTHLYIHIPEYFVTEFNQGVKNFLPIINKYARVTINIMNQNIKLMPHPDEVRMLYAISDEVTQTAAHCAYSTQENANKYCTPILHLSVTVNPDLAKFKNTFSREKLIAYSPDMCKEKKLVLSKLENALEDYTFIEIKNFTYENYLKLIARSTAVLTFGEGLDYYFIEPYLMGRLSFAVYNDTFFDEKYLTIPTVCKSWSQLVITLPDMLTRLEKNDLEYNSVSTKGANIINQDYGQSLYINNIRRYYSGSFDYTPTSKSIYNALHKELGLNLERSAKTKELRDDLASTLKDLDSIINSHSWKITSPVRKMSRIIKQLVSKPD